MSEVFPEVFEEHEIGDDISDAFDDPLLKNILEEAKIHLPDIEIDIRRMDSGIVEMCHSGGCIEIGEGEETYKVAKTVLENLIE